MFTYSYEGPIYRFERVYTRKWKGYTSAVSEAKALANLAFKAKQEFGFNKTAKLILDKKYLKLEEKK